MDQNCITLSTREVITHPSNMIHNRSVCGNDDQDYSDVRSQMILGSLKLAYAHLMSLILDDVAEENCTLCYGPNHVPRPSGFSVMWHKKDLCWYDKNDKYGHMALVWVKEEDVMTEWLQNLNKLQPPAHPVEYPDLMSPLNWWTKVTDEVFIIDVLLLLEQFNPIL